MATVYEIHESRSVSIDTAAPSTRRRYVILDADDELEADAALLAEAPANVLSLLRNGRSVEPRGGGVWLGEVNYGTLQSAPLDGQGDPANEPTPPPTPSQTDHLGGEFSFDTSGGSVHITQSLETKQKAVREDEVVVAPNFGRAIGVTRDAVEGCDIVVPKLEFQLTFKHSFMTLAYIKMLRDMVGTTNDRKMWGFERGEMLFLGASGNFKGGEEGWPVTYRFLTAKNRDEVVIVPGDGNDPPILAVGPVRGHDFVWVAYSDATDEQALIQRPRFAYVERVYEESDFTRFGAGGA